MPHLGHEKRSIGKCLYLLHVEGVKYSLVFGPGDELERRMGLDVTVNDPCEMEWQVLDGWSEHHPSWV